jgi:uncharacterized RDD family membrane protein YckC
MKIKRIMAYIIDYAIVYLISAVILLIPAFSYDQEQYLNYYEDYMTMPEEITKDTLNNQYSLLYKMTKLSKNSLIIEGIVAFSYFGIAAYLMNGQTLGKKMFGICLMMDNGVKIKTLPLFVRTLLGKFTIETMIPVYFIVLLYFGHINLLHIVILGVLVIAELLLIIIHRKNPLLHDLMSYTVVVDKESQMIFDTEEDLIKYKQEMAKKNAVSKKTF